MSAKHKNWPTLGLIVISAALTAYTFTNVPKVESASFNIDQFSQVMILIVNIIGTAIILFATGYMDHYEEHRHLNQAKNILLYNELLLSSHERPGNG